MPPKKLGDNNRFFQLMADNILDGLAIIENNKIIYVNNRLCEITGYYRDELFMLDSFDIIAPEMQSRIKKDSGDRQPREMFEENEYEIVRKDGTRRFINSRHSHTLNDDGKSIFYHFEVITDITERKLAEEDLKQQKYYLEKSQELGLIGTWELDLRPNRLVWTDANCHIFGVPPGTVVNYDIFLEKVHPDDREYVDQEWKAALQGKPYDIEHRILIDGKQRWVREKADVDFDNGGKAIKAIGFTQDITARKQSEEKLRVLNQELETRIEQRTATLKVTNERLTKGITELIEAEKELEAQKESLVELNTALRVMLRKGEENKRELEENMLFNVNELVLPYADKLIKTQLAPRQRECLNVIKSNLSDIISPFGRTLSLSVQKLSPQEIRIADLIKMGRTTKEIAEVLNLSELTITTHRHNIRKKLGLNTKKANLQTHLLNIL
jgi:PAS domain S-box-containing protein